MKYPTIARSHCLLLLLLVGLLMGCGTAPTKPISGDSIWQGHLKTGKNAFERGDYERAAEAYQRAAERATVMDNADAFAVAAINRAACLLSENRISEALKEMENISDAILTPSIQADAYTMMMRIALLSGDAPRAEGLIVQALNIPQISEATRAQILCIWSSLALEREDPKEAARRLQYRFSPSKWERQPATIRAGYYVSQGNIAAANQQFSAALAHGEKAVETYRAAGRFSDMAHTLKKCGDWAAANQQYKIASD